MFFLSYLPGGERNSQKKSGFNQHVFSLLISLANIFFLCSNEMFLSDHYFKTQNCSVLMRQKQEHPHTEADNRKSYFSVKGIFRETSNFWINSSILIFTHVRTHSLSHWQTRTDGQWSWHEHSTLPVHALSDHWYMHLLSTILIHKWWMCSCWLLTDPLT